MVKDILMSIDIGTTGCKTILVDSRGAIVASEIEGYPFYSPKHGWAEQEPLDWWKAVQKTIKKVTSKYRDKIKRLRGIGLTGQMHGLVALDKDNEVIRPAILWNDQRTEKQCNDVYEKVGDIDGLLKYTNNRMLPGYTGGKILWLRENEPSNYKRIYKLLNPKDYIRLRLTGEYATEVSDASGTGLFNVRERKWSNPLLDTLEIPERWMPECFESIEVSGKVTDSISDSLGLPGGLPVVGGGGDSVIQTLGTGVIKNDVLMTTIGTAGIISTALEAFTHNPGGKLQIFCNVMPSEWHIMGVTLAAGGSMRWAREVLAHSEQEIAHLSSENVYKVISREAEQSPPGSNGLIFLPYLQGERCPHINPDARGAFIGLSHNSNKCDFFRSVMEGVIFSFMDVAELFTQLGMTFKNIATSGGGAQSNLWRQIHADIFKKQVITVNGSREGAAYGAAVVAGVGLGVWSDFNEAVKILQIETSNDPDKKNYALYDHLFSIYKNLYGLLKDSFTQITEYENLIMPVLQKDINR